MYRMGRGCGVGSTSPIKRIVASARGHVPSESERQFYGDLIRALAVRRRALGISQQALDRILGVSDHQVAAWESFKRLPGAFMMMCWANALGTKLVVIKDEEPET